MVHRSSGNAAVFERCADAWREEPLGNLLSWQGASGESAVFQLLDDQGWGLVD